MPGRSICLVILVGVRDRLTVRGHSLEVGSWGDGDPPIVLLHEGLGSVARWRDFPLQLALSVRCRVFAYSRAGHGASEPPRRFPTARFMHEEAIDWLPELLDCAGIHRAVLLGHSDGASIAIIFAATYPARVHSLVLEAPHVFVEDISIASIERAKRRYQTTDFAKRLGKYHERPEAAFRGWNDVWLSAEFRHWNLEEYLPPITCPVLLIQGEDDEYGSIRQLETIARGVRGPVETVILPHCGHAPHRHQPGWTLGAITTFLSRRH
jgi:pimeloyl-ACP methyl ester carboxylesterase